MFGDLGGQGDALARSKLLLRGRNRRALRLAVRTVVELVGDRAVIAYRPQRGGGHTTGLRRAEQSKWVIGGSAAFRPGVVGISFLINLGRTVAEGQDRVRILVLALGLVLRIRPHGFRCVEVGQICERSRLLGRPFRLSDCLQAHIQAFGAGIVCADLHIECGVSRVILLLIQGQGALRKGVGFVVSDSYGHALGGKDVVYHTIKGLCGLHGGTQLVRAGDQLRCAAHRLYQSAA